MEAAYTKDKYYIPSEKAGVPDYATGYLSTGQFVSHCFSTQDLQWAYGSLLLQLHMVEKMIEEQSQ